jgi:hypothetical protein
MNERIRELAEQTNWWKPLGLPSNWNEGDYVVSPEQMKKFAELIVKETMRVVANNVAWNSYLNAAEAVIEHFGVEE